MDKPSNNTDKRSFLLFNDYLKKLEDLEDSELGKVFRAILEYANYKKLSKDLPKKIKFVFNFIREDMDNSEKAYFEKLERLREAGRLGGKKRASNAKQNQAMLSDAKQSQAPSSISRVSVNDSISLTNVNDDTMDNLDFFLNGKISLSPKEELKKLFDDKAISEEDYKKELKKLEANENEHN